jgi:hypothetical protein
VAKSAEERFASIGESELRAKDVTAGTGFGSNAGLRISGKIYAMLVRGELVVKLQKDRVQELTEAGVGHPFEPGPGRLMKEWVAIHDQAARPSLVEEAREFVRQRKA